MIYDDYVAYTHKYQAIYGPKTLVFIEVGSFFEIYGVQNEVEVTGANMMEIGSVLNIQVSRKNKSILENSRENPMMAGFPNHSLKKFLDILVQHNYTIVIIEQVTPPPNPKREVTQIISPSTYVDNLTSHNSNHLMIIYIEEFKHWKHVNKKSFGIGVSVVDISTSKTYVLESFGDVASMNEELTRVCLLYQPKELVVFSKDEVETPLHIPNNILCHNKLNHPENKRFTDHNYCSSVLHKLFAARAGMLTPVEYLNLEKLQLATVAFSYMLDFVHSHNESLLANVTKPVVEEPHDNLILTNNCLSQLDIVGKTDCLADILNHCITAMGKRFFHRCITHPICDPSTLNALYDDTERCITQNKYASLRASLKNVHDIERIVNKTHIHPHNWTCLYTSLVEIQRFGDIDVSSLVAHIEATVDAVTCGKYNITNIDENLFVVGYDSELDALQAKLDTISAFFETTHSSIKDFVRLEKYDKEGLTFVTTAKRFKDLNNQTFSCAKFKQNLVRVYTPDIDKKNSEYLEIKELLRANVAQRFHAYCVDFLRRFAEPLQQAIRFVEHTDFVANNAFNAVRMGLVKPTLSVANEYAQPSFVCAQQLRHPIIEHVQHDIRYVPNDVTLDPHTRGLILYGINAAGKSSLMKSVGIAVIMAQAGMFVAAKQFQFFPYKDVHTRILSHDNLYKHQSTFTVEMSELRTILQKSTDRSLVIGDELCSGTESISAISLVTAGITHLSKRNASFIFATHLHELSQLDEITVDLKNVAIKHLSVKHDRATNTIVYDRVLKDGSGDTLYGLEVCQSLDLDADFLNTANTIRRKLLNTSNEIVRNKKSHFNAAVYMDVCHLCKTNAEDVHHIDPQANADENGMIDGRHHKNIRFNLVPLCKKCHDAVHNDEIEIQGVFQTTYGKSVLTKRTNLKRKNKIINTKKPSDVDNTLVVAS